MGRSGSLAVLVGLEPAAEEEAQGRAIRREDVERLRERWNLLDREDRLLLKMHLEAGSSFDELARVTGRDRSAVCRRIHGIIRRLGDETYARCARDHTSFSMSELSVVRDRFVRGRSLARIARDHHLCRYRVCLIIRKAHRCTGAA